MPNTASNRTINLPEVNARADTAQHIVIGFSRAIPNLADLWQQIIHSLADIPILTAEVTRLRGELVVIRLHRANLAAAGRASIAAYHEDERDPLSYLTNELDTQGFGTPGRPA